MLLSLPPEHSRGAGHEASVKKTYFPYLVQSKDLVFTAIELYDIDGKNRKGATLGVDLDDLAQALNTDDVEKSLLQKVMFYNALTKRLCY